jgi:hypothetical protein
MRREMPGIEFVQEGTDGVNATLPTADLEQVAERLRLYRRKRYTPEQLAASSHRLEEWRRTKELSVAIGTPLSALTPMFVPFLVGLL